MRIPNTPRVKRDLSPSKRRKAARLHAHAREAVERMMDREDARPQGRDERLACGRLGISPRRLQRSVERRRG